MLNYVLLDHNALQQILEVDILLVRLITQTMLAMHLRTGLMEVATHGEIRWVAWQTGGLTSIGLLLLHVADEQDLANNNTPEDTPDCEDAFKGVDLCCLSVEFVL